MRSAKVKVNKALHKAKEEYYQFKVESAKTQSELFKVANALLYRGKNESLPPHETDSELAYQFSRFFTDKIETIRMTLDSDSHETLSEHLQFNGNILASFHEASVGEIHNNSKRHGQQTLPT